MEVRRSIDEPIRTGQSWYERWDGPDKGLITCWENGREAALKNPELAQLAKNGRLMPLGWKGGVEQQLKLKHKYGTYKYLAKWQGLRGDDLQIDTASEVTVACSLTGMTVTFTADASKYVEP